MPGCKPGRNICPVPGSIKAEFPDGRQGRNQPERGQLHNGCYCELDPCEQAAKPPIKPIRCLKI